MDEVELVVLRRRLAELEEALARAGSPDAKRRAARLCQVYNGGATPTTGGKFYLTHPAVVLPGATEGSSATISVDSSRSDPVDAIGPTAPAAGVSTGPATANAASQAWHDGTCSRARCSTGMTASTGR